MISFRIWNFLPSSYSSIQWLILLRNPWFYRKSIKILHSAGEIWKRSFISTVRPTVHTDASRKLSFPKTFFKPEEFKNAGFAFWCRQKTFRKRSLSKTITSNIHVISLPIFPQTQIQNYSGVVWTKNIWCVFRVKTPFSNFSSEVWTGPNNPNLAMKKQNQSYDNRGNNSKLIS